MYLPNEIKEIIKGLRQKIDNIGRSDDTVIIYENKYILKISKNINKLHDEYLKINWLSNKLPVSTPVCFTIENDQAFFLRTYVEGKSLINEEYLKTLSY